MIVVIAMIIVVCFVITLNVLYQNALKTFNTNLAWSKNQHRISLESFNNLLRGLSLRQQHQDVETQNYVHGLEEFLKARIEFLDKERTDIF